MTGQGNTRHAMIKAAKQHERTQLLSQIDLSKEYRTANGSRVRALQFNYRKQKVFLFGNIQHTGNQERCINGQVCINNEWQMQAWDLTGRHDYNDDLNLQEYKAPAVKLPELFK